MATKGNMPIFAVGKMSQIQPAIQAEVLTYPSYVFVSDTNNLVFVDKNLNIQKVVGDNKQTVLNVEALPLESEADKDVLYICENVVYSFDGSDYHALNSEAVISDITERVEQLETDIVKKEIVVGELPEAGENGQLYISEDNIPYIWNTVEEKYYPLTIDNENGFIELDD